MQLIENKLIMKKYMTVTERWMITSTILQSEMHKKDNVGYLSAMDVTAICEVLAQLVNFHKMSDMLFTTNT